MVGAVLWDFQCDCGARTTYAGAEVTSGKRWRCRTCYLVALRKGRAPRKPPPRKPRKVSPERVHPREYYSWKSMMARCNPTSSYRANYADRGIGLDHAPWTDFYEFLRDMGTRPEGMTLDRKDNDAGYSPGNCRWATPKEQISNTRVAHRLSTPLGVLTATQAAEALDISVSAICNRVKKDGQAATEAWIKTKLELKNGI